MLVRFVVKNLFSFHDETEFNLLPGKTKRLNHHKYKVNQVEVLKLSALYGANGAGKSNLIRSISLLKKMLLDSSIPTAFSTQKFRLSKSTGNEPVEMSIEFFTNSFIYYYAVSINEGIILDEYFSSLAADGEDEMIFHREYKDKKTSISFFKEFEEKEENKTLKKIIETDLLKTNQPLFSLLNTITNDHFIHIKEAYHWLNENLTIIYPDTKAAGLVLAIDANSHFKDFAVDTMESFSTGITDLKIEAKTIEDFLGKGKEKEIEEIKAELKNNPEKKIGFMANNTTKENVAVVNDDGEIMVKRLVFEHIGEKEEKFEFSFSEESDGTKRLLEYLPVLNNIISQSQTFIIDEIERSIHPLIVKELVSKFSADEVTKGQLIFTTHESNLLDQEIFRPDEIWFAEKNIIGATKLYSLSDFKEHNTIDIRKGYLSGRYGAIPFVGNLHDLNWHKFQDEAK